MAVHIILGSVSFVCLSGMERKNFSHGEISMLAVITQEAIIHEKEQKSFPHPWIAFTFYTEKFFRFLPHLMKVWRVAIDVESVEQRQNQGNSN